MSIHVVYAIEGGLYRAILTLDQYTTNDLGKIILPESCYSSGFCDRVWDVDWQSLPWYNGANRRDPPDDEPASKCQRIV